MNRFLTYVRQSFNELRKVVWPSRPTAIKYTIAVIVFAIVIAIFIGVVDYFFAQVVQQIILKG